MLIRVSRVKAGGEPLAHTTIVKVGGEQRFKSLLGVNIVAGLTGSGKTLLAEALWLGVAHALSSLLRDLNAFVSAARGLIDAEFTVCLSKVEGGCEEVVKGASESLQSLVLKLISRATSRQMPLQRVWERFLGFRRGRS
jgi:hypothetical protein